MIIAIFSPYYTTFKSKDYYDKIQNLRTFPVINWGESNKNVIKYNIRYFRMLLKCYYGNSVTLCTCQGNNLLLISHKMRVSFAMICLNNELTLINIKEFSISCLVTINGL